MRKLFVLTALSAALVGCDDAGTGTAASAIASTAVGAAAASAAPGTGAALGEMDVEKRILGGIQMWNEGKFDVVLAAYADDSEWNVIATPDGPAKGKDEIKLSWEDMKASFPDVKIAYKRVFIAEGMWIVQAVITGTHNGDFMGHAATGKPVGTEYVAVVETEGGKVSSTTLYADQTAFLKQIGAIPGPAPVIPEPPASTEVIKVPGNPDNIEKTKAFYAAVTSGDLSGYDKSVTPEFSVTDHVMGTTITGAAETKAEMAKMAATFTGMALTVQDAWAIGPYVIVTVEMTGTHAGDLGPIKATGKSVTLHAIDVIHMEEDKAVSVETYGNGLELAEQLDLTPEAPAPDGT